MPTLLIPAPTATPPTARDHLYLEHQRLVVAHFERGLSPEEEARLTVVRAELDLAELAGNASVLAALHALATSQERLVDEIQSFVHHVDNLPRVTSNHASAIAWDFLVPVDLALRPSALFLAMETQLGPRDPDLADYCCACGCDLKKTSLVVGAGSGGGRRFACEPCWKARPVAP
jgi:hypothetical protein